MTDDTDLRAAVHRLEAENKRLWAANDELMRDQVAIEKRLDRLEKAKRLKPPAEESVE